MPSLKSLPKLGKLKDLEKEVLAPVAIPDSESADEAVDEGTTAPVNLQQLEEAWKEYIRQLEHLDEAMILDRPYQVSEQGEITLQIDNPVQINIFEKFREDLLHTLRRRTGNNRIRIKLEVKEQDTTNRLYTNVDRLKYLSEKYPLLQEMTNKLGLDSPY